MKTLFLLSILVLAFDASSTTLPQVAIEDLHETAEFVGIVLIEEGKLIRKGNIICASQYTAKVIEAFKGNYKEGEQLTFGPYRGQGIGNKYLLFLIKKESPYKPMASTNSISMARDEEYRKTCGSILPDLLVSFHGMGVFEIGTPSQFNYQDSIKIPEKFVSIPSVLSKKAAEYGDDRILGKPYWVKEEEFRKYMREHYK